jgi:hypothetical protein
MRRPKWPLAVSAAVISAICVGLAAAQRPVYAALPALIAERPSDTRLLAQLGDPGTTEAEALGIAQQLWDRRALLDRARLIGIVLDQRQSDQARWLCVDLLSGDPDKSCIAGDVRALLTDVSLDPSVKSRILSQNRFDPADSDLLRGLARCADDSVAFFALKKLSTVDTGTACLIAGETLEDVAATDARLSAAYKTLIRAGAARDDAAMRLRLVRHLGRVLADPETSPALRDSACFALADAAGMDALAMLLGSPGADHALLAGAVDQNAQVIKAALAGDPDEATVALAVRAMEIHPLTDLAGPLQSARRYVTNPELARRLDTALARIGSEGVVSCTKWNED